MNPGRVVERFMAAAALVRLPGRNRSIEYNHTPKQVADALVKNPVVYIQDPAGFIDPKELARDVVERVSTSFILESRKADRAGNKPWAAALDETSREVEKHLSVMVQPIKSPRSGDAGWRVFTRPTVASLWQKAEALTREE